MNILVWKMLKKINDPQNEKSNCIFLYIVFHISVAKLKKPLLHCSGIMVGVVLGEYCLHASSKQ
jgi:hypothetical protein